MEIDGWTINREDVAGAPLYMATGPYDENGYRPTIPLMIKMRVPTDEHLREALRRALDDRKASMP